MAIIVHPGGKEDWIIEQFKLTVKRRGDELPQVFEVEAYSIGTAYDVAIDMGALSIAEVEEPFMNEYRGTDIRMVNVADEQALQERWGGPFPIAD